MARTVRRADISGIWATRSVLTNSAWTAAVQTELTTAYNLSPMYSQVGGAVRGLSIRTKASTLTPSNGVYDDTLLNNARTLANSLGCKLSIRVMAGEHCPAYLFNSVASGGLGCRYWLNGNGGTRKWVATGSMTSGSAVLTIQTDATTFFQAGDVGEPIIVYGAGVAGADMITTIIGFTNSSTVTLGATASTSKNPATICWGGEKVPHPCTTNGSPNAVFGTWFDGLVSHLKGWCQSHDVQLLHLTWYSNKYSEPYGDDNHLSPVAGYDANGNNWRAAMSTLLDTAESYADSNVSVEFASSGTYGAVGGISSTLAHGATIFGNFSPRYYIQENGIEFGINQYHGLGNANTSRAGQMYTSKNYTPTQWVDVFDSFVVPDNLDYLEVYTNSQGGSSSFTGTGAPTLKAQAEAWIATLVEPGVAGFVADAASLSGVGTETGVGVGNIKPAKPAFAGVGTHQISITGTGGVGPSAPSFQGAGSATSSVVGRLNALAPSLHAVAYADQNVIAGIDAPSTRLRGSRVPTRVRGSTGNVLRGEGGPRTRVTVRLRPRTRGGYLRGVASPNGIRTGAGKTTIASIGAFAAPVPTLSGHGAVGDVVGAGTLTTTKPSFAGTGTETMTGVGTLAPKLGAILHAVGASGIANGNVTMAAAAFASTGVVGASDGGLCLPSGIIAAAASFAGVGTENIAPSTGAFAAAMSAFAGVGTETISGAGAFAAGSAVLTGAGSEEQATGTGAFAAAAASLASTGFQTSDGFGAIEATPAELAGTGVISANGVGAFAAAPMALSGTSSQGIEGTAAFAAGAAALAGISVFTTSGSAEFFARMAELQGLGQVSSGFRAAAASFSGLGAGGSILDDATVSGPVGKWHIHDPEEHWRLTLQPKGS